MTNPRKSRSSRMAWPAHAAGAGFHRAVRFGLALSACAFVAITTAHAQDKPLLERPNAHIVQGGNVNASVRLPDGSRVFGGTFISVDGVLRSSLFKRRPDGTLDPDWNPAIVGGVSALAADSAGNVYVGGGFTSAGGLPRSRLFKVSGDGVGVVDPDWDPTFSVGTFDAVHALAVDAAGDVYVGGRFSQIGGQPLNNIAKLSGSGTGAADPNWSPDSDGPVRTIVSDASGTLFVGGEFTEIGGRLRRNIAKMSANGIVDMNWNVSPCPIYALAFDSAGSLFAGGDGCLHKLSTAGSGAIDPNWAPAVGTPGSTINDVLSLAADAAGDIWVGGYFFSLGGVERRHLARVSGSTGMVDPDWNPSPDEPVRSIRMDADGTVAIGGEFETFGDLTRLGLAVVSPDGTIEAAMDAEVPGEVRVLARQPDGGTILGGDFLKVDGYPRQNLARLRGDGRIDPDWNPSADSWVNGLAVDAAGDVYVGGRFDVIGGQPRDGIAKLSGSGSGAVDPDWHPVISGNFGADFLLMDAAGDLYLGGLLESVDGLPRKSLAKMLTSSTGEVDPNWNPEVDFTLYTAALDKTGNLYVGGSFESVGGQPRKRLAKLSAATGALDPDWKPSSNGSVFDMVIDAAGDVFIAGLFTAVDGLSRQHIAKLSGGGSGAVDPNWNPAPDDIVEAVAVDAAGNVYAGGRFAAIGGEPRARLARLSGSGTGAADPTWVPRLVGSRVLELEVDAMDNLWVGGYFATIDEQPRTSVAAFGVIPDSIFVDGFESPALPLIDAEG